MPETTPSVKPSATKTEVRQTPRLERSQEISWNNAARVETQRAVTPKAQQIDALADVAGVAVGEVIEADEAFKILGQQPLARVIESPHEPEKALESGKQPPTQADITEETLTTEPERKVENPLGLRKEQSEQLFERELKNLETIQEAIERGEITSELQEFWRGAVRDVDGRFEKYLSRVSYYKGKQDSIDVNNAGVVDYLTATINTRKAFLEGLRAGRIQLSNPENPNDPRNIEDFKKWLVELHTKQAYKGEGGRLDTGSKFHGSNVKSMTPIIADDIARLAREYNDPYAQFLDDPRPFDYYYGLQLPGINSDAPGDEMIINSREGWKKPNLQELQRGYSINIPTTGETAHIEHRYPDATSHNEYFRMMQTKLIELDSMEITAPQDNQLRAIAEFYQYATAPRLFTSVNNSLWMNMVNGLLGQRGLKPIEHGILDFAAMRLQPVNFTQYFREEVMRAQKEPIAQPSI